MKPSPVYTPPVCKAKDPTACRFHGYSYDKAAQVAFNPEQAKKNIQESKSKLLMSKDFEETIELEKILSMDERRYTYTLEGLKELQDAKNEPGLDEFEKEARERAYRFAIDNRHSETLIAPLKKINDAILLFTRRKVYISVDSMEPGDSRYLQKEYVEDIRNAAGPVNMCIQMNDGSVIIDSVDTEMVVGPKRHPFDRNPKEVEKKKVDRESLTLKNSQVPVRWDDVKRVTLLPDDLARIRMVDQLRNVTEPATTPSEGNRIVSYQGDDFLYQVEGKPNGYDIYGNTVLEDSSFPVKLAPTLKEVFVV